jgi:RNA polymerase sigma factor for flagellar operon FliA
MTRARNDGLAAGKPNGPEIESRVREGMELVGIIARQLRRQLGARVDVAELESMGREGLLDAARSFEPERGVPFRRWANLRVRGAMFDGLRSTGGLPRAVYRKLRALGAADAVQKGRLEDDAASPPATAEAADKRLADSLSGMAMAMAAGFLTASSEGLDRVVDGEVTPEQLVVEKELLDSLRAHITRLPDAERQLLERYYFGELTLEEAGRELGLSKSWASRLHARAIEAVALAMRDDAR